MNKIGKQLKTNVDILTSEFYLKIKLQGRSLCKKHLCSLLLKMIFNPKIFKPSVLAFTITCAVTIAAYYYRTRKISEINEVLIFSKLHLNIHNYFDRLVSYIENAEFSVNICMPGIHNPAIQDRLVRLLKKKNIKIRIIIDQSAYNEWTATFLIELKEAGAEIKWKNSEYSMGHKFCIMDDKLLMIGTLDWGCDLSLDDRNYVLVTDKKSLVKPITQEFYAMWDSCKNGIL